MAIFYVQQVVEYYNPQFYFQVATKIPKKTSHWTTQKVRETNEVLSLFSQVVREHEQSRRLLVHNIICHDTQI